MAGRNKWPTCRKIRGEDGKKILTTSHITIPLLDIKKNYSCLVKFLFIFLNTNFTNNTNQKVTQVNHHTDRNLLIAYEFHEYPPDGNKSWYWLVQPSVCVIKMPRTVIRVIRMRLAKKYIPHGNWLARPFGSCYSWNSCSLKHRNSVFFRLLYDKGLYKHNDLSD